MLQFRNRKFNECISSYAKLIDEIGDDVEPSVLATLYCNKATAEKELGLYRKAIKSCESAVSSYRVCLQAYILQGDVFLKMGRPDQARQCWGTGIELIDDFCNMSILIDFETRLSRLDYPLSGDPSNTSGSVIAAVESPEAPVIPTPKSDTTSPPPTINESVIRAEHAVTSSDSNSSTDPIEAKIRAPSSQSEKDAKATAHLQLALIRSHFIGEDTMSVSNSDTRIHPLLLASAKKSLSHASGEELVDDLIAVGYLLVNSGSLPEACELFSVLLNYRPDLFAAHLAMGSALALQHQFDAAISSLSSAIAVDPSEADAWKRRGQTRAAKGTCHEALKDYNRALQLQPGDADTYYQRALCYNQMKNYKLALVDLKIYNEMGGEQSARFWNYLGMCESQLGNISSALEAYEKAIALDSSVVEAYINYAQMLKEAGRWKESGQAFDTLFRMHPHAFPGHYYRGLLHYAQGDSMEALGSMRRFLGAVAECSKEELASAGVGEKEVIAALATSALCLQALGAYYDALDNFNKVLKRDPGHVCRVQKQILMFYFKRLDRPMSSFNIDNTFEPAWKEMWCKAAVCHESIIPDDVEESHVCPLPPCFEVNEMTNLIVSISQELAPWVQLSSPGFMPHRRQQRAFGLAVLQMAHALIRNCESLRVSGRPMAMSNTASSQRHLTSTQSRNAGHEGVPSDKHGFAYRDLCDIAVKWRQLAEPNDAVWWIDRLPSKSFEEGFGLQTPMVNGQLKCIRYYSYFEMGFGLLKKLAVERGYYDASSTRRQLTHTQQKTIETSTSLDEVYRSIGEDFYVVCPCQSSLDDTTILEGTRLTVLAKPPDGYDFSIRCPGLPSKWLLMDAELHACFDDIISDLMTIRRGDQSDKLLMDALKFFYYWTNFSPLSRGSAQTGYAVLMACMLAGGRRIHSPIPHGVQFDWEAIFTPEFPTFYGKISPMISTDRHDWSIDKIDFEEGIPTLQAMIHLLNS